jgi:hypothetical protein
LYGMANCGQPFQGRTWKPSLDPWWSCSGLVLCPIMW